MYLFCHYCDFVFWCLRKNFIDVALVSLELFMQAILDSVLQRSTCLSLQNSGTRAIYHYAWEINKILNVKHNSFKMISRIPTVASFMSNCIE